MCGPGAEAVVPDQGGDQPRASDDQQEAGRAPRRQADPVRGGLRVDHHSAGGSRPQWSTTRRPRTPDALRDSAISLPVRRRESSGRKAADATHLPYAWTPRRRRRCGKTDSYASMPTRSMRPARFPRSLSPTRRFAPRYRVGDDPLIKNGLTWRVEGCLPGGRRARAERWEVVDRVGRTRGAPASGRITNANCEDSTSRRRSWTAGCHSAAVRSRCPCSWALASEA